MNHRFLLAISLTAAAVFFAGCSSTKGVKGGLMAGGPGGPGGAQRPDKSADSELTAMIDEVAPKFTLESYTDPETGLTVSYELFLPEGYDGTTEYPMVVFIADASTAGADPEVSLTQGWGGLIWATDEFQQENPAIVLIPTYPEVILDDNTGEFVTTPYVDLTPRLIKSVAETYHADQNRIYGTGQSMGCMTTLIASGTNPDLYAAELFVDGQWDYSVLPGLKDQTFLYIAASDDTKAAEGQKELMKLFDQEGVPYSFATGWDAQSDDQAITDNLDALLSEGNERNFIQWKEGTVRQGVSASINNAHMAAFDYAYKFSAIRSWLFAQSK